MQQSYAVEETELINMHRIVYSTDTKYTFFLSVHGAFPMVELMLGYKKSQQIKTKLCYDIY